MESGYRKWTAKAYVGDCVDVWTPDFSFVIHVSFAKCAPCLDGNCLRHVSFLTFQKLTPPEVSNCDTSKRVCLWRIGKSFRIISRRICYHLIR